MAWDEDFAKAVDNGSVKLNSVPAREVASSKILAVLTDLNRSKAQQDEAIFRLLDACKVFMRDRRGIDKLLSAEAIDSFLLLAENQSGSSSTREEALKCMINSVYSRPYFISKHIIATGIAARLLSLAKNAGTVTLHSLVWKFLLVSCEASEVPQHMSRLLEVWQLIYTTLFYGFKIGNMADIVSGARSNLILELIKLISVLANEMQWTAEHEKLVPDIFHCVHRLGGLLLDILCFKHPGVSPLNNSLVKLKNKVMEVLMLLPGNLLAAFLAQQHTKKADADKKSLVTPVVDHLHTMLLVVRIEKTRPLKEMLPTLIVCHNLARTGIQEILNCFKMSILPLPQPSEAYSSAFDQTNALNFKHLTSFLTCLDTEVRRYSSEWLFLLCDQNGMHPSNIKLTFFTDDPARLYTQHTGIGNAIGLLRIKGLA